MTLFFNERISVAVGSHAVHQTRFPTWVISLNSSKENLMSNYKALFQSARFFIIIVVIAGAVFLGGNVWSSNKSQKSKIEVNNHTQSFQVINAEKHDDHIKLYLRNDSQKSITAFVISSAIGPRDTFSVKRELVYSAFDDSFITAGSVYEAIFGIPGSLKSRKIITIDLMAVVFDDKSSEGDPEVIQGIEDERLAEKTLFARAIPLIDAMLILPNNKMQSYLKDNLRTELLVALDAAKEDFLVQMKKERPYLLSRIGKEESLEPVDNGLRNGRGYLMELIKDWEDAQKTEDKDNIREEMLKSREILEKILSRL